MGQHKLIAKHCLHCLQLFHARLSDTRNGQGKFCSRSCRQAFYPHSGKLNPNWKGGISRNRARYTSIYKEKFPERYKAGQIVYHAIRRGKLHRQPCEVCGELKVHGHHEDYSKPLDVKWLCVKHHHPLHHGKFSAALTLFNP